jgi:hypothetical protein
MRAIPVAIILGLTALPAVANAYWVIENRENRLWKVDVTTLQATLVGDLGFNYSFGGIAFSADGRLWATDSTSQTFGTIDPATGAYSVLSTHGRFGVDTFDINPVDGRGYGLDVKGIVYEADFTTGAFNTVRTVPDTECFGSAFDTDGRWFHLDSDANSLAYVNPLQGDRVFVGNLGFNTNATNLGYNPVDGQLYFIQITDPNYPLYRVNPQAAVTTFVGNISGFSYISGNQQITAGTFVIPAPASGVAMALTGIAAARRRRNERMF